MGISGTSVLLLEDQPLIALDIEDVLQDAGYADVTTISSCEEAEKWLEAHSPDLVILDIKLRDGDCTNIVDTMKKRRISFLVHSGSERPSGPEAAVFQGARWVMKPSTPEILVRCITACLAERPGSSSAFRSSPSVP
ncbi:response regulator [Agrobacterium rhizogenes]|jgi:DNA-binding response OmpR family regulator|nr:response regulator [Rhizobium rhizogenes]NTH62168.1 response regulator [Rhizobium rhizogenes]NTH93794.1 response regulator [Rhizobium rhizogenes]